MSSALMILVYSFGPPAQPPLTLINTFHSLTLKSSGEKASRSDMPFWVDTYQKIFVCADFSVSFFWTCKGISRKSFMNTPNWVRILYSTSNWRNRVFLMVMLCPVVFPFWLLCVTKQEIWSAVICCFEIHTNDPQRRRLNMELNLREECWIQFCLCRQ
jgi:hypothetical protein